MKKTTTNPEVDSILNDLMPDSGVDAMSDFEEENTDTQSVEDSQPVEVETEPETVEPEVIEPATTDDEWNDFIKNLQEDDGDQRSSRVSCRIDSDVAFTIDTLDISRKTRAAIINSILRTFLIRHSEVLKMFQTQPRSII